MCMKYKFPAQILHASVDARYLSKSDKFTKPFNNKISYLNIRTLTESLILIIKFSYIQGFGLLNEINKKDKINKNILRFLIIVKTHFFVK